MPARGSGGVPAAPAARGHRQFGRDSPPIRVPLTPGTPRTCRARAGQRGCGGGTAAGTSSLSNPPAAPPQGLQVAFHTGFCQRGVSFTPPPRGTRTPEVFFLEV